MILIFIRVFLLILMVIGFVFDLLILSSQNVISYENCKENFGESRYFLCVTDSGSSCSANDF